MRRVGRILLNVATGVSLLLCVAMIGMWAWSYRTGVGWNWSEPHGIARTRFETIRSWAGRVGYAMEDIGYTWMIGPPHDDGWVTFEPTSDHTRQTFGLTTDITDARSVAGFGVGPWDRSHRYAAIPYWFIVTATGAPAGLWAARRIGRSRLAKAGRCPACGYDCRATPDRCPECGTAPEGIR